ncbi:hypothetical protein A3F08_00395 [Candidatus Berkelbacteria bacterium RIFCSPHIGHO2_12_FULL_36_9]|uniref:Glycosyltransferase 2-like prokaryotic type domain-containing protein n=1 Tax=Candidatus Berkelbacteria bacterium RIFCSPHIGHO2_12_FULL_36_9 TaxID=1797469 RepID=A0A1F5EHY4_9BACT|nr:MAG: hypothetical protein A3F08_00395 [Candidatus Berkelbacteria bacterium RIFCSPHIGHO2_12_FULL_36_9]
MKISIIIPVIKINDYVRESIPEILKLKENIEIIILPNKKTDEKFVKTKIIPTKNPSPSNKRNLGVKKATGEIIAFLDDDAYPKPDWLKFALIHFADKNIIGVGGPAITPDSDSTLQKASAAVFESFIGGGSTRKRYLSVGKKCLVDDWPSVNLLVRRNVFLKTNGFDEKFWPGEDTKLCLELIKYGKIIYEPNAIVYHHRRASLMKHLRQIGNYGLHRGHFARRYPENSLRLFYIIPSIFSLYLIFGLIFEIGNLFRSSYLVISIFYWYPLFLYFALIIIDAIFISIRHKNPLVGILTIPYIFLTHFYYGLRFIKGYLLSNITHSAHAKKTQ